MDKITIIKDFLNKGMKEITRPGDKELLEKRLNKVENAEITEDMLHHIVYLLDALEIISDKIPELDKNINWIINTEGPKLTEVFIVPNEQLSKIQIPSWLASKNGLATSFKAVITKETEKAIQINYETWLPKSQTIIK
ncbi:hypothetical protein [Clostridium luticellarii]|uniref:Uncharacterized protein n=1 Tax=Clostridium luticellarii TaxID=1691940 RepID=A0A2T0BNR0_9CLOT|nr:hypothetical protein [Clostridium luticellarii]PRR85519.1 hypothetical protein CLLU_14400 [Clostridium luticellarii]